ncbi:MAG TPA: D-2-hydroxyacid dehydrogenase [Candidatus Acidoferrales bacterium]|nr:D-2-hydroxyacid dehydrogenase [Candidatus Acidoferrales bacterium]
MKKTTILLLRGGKEVPPLALLDGLRETENIVVGDSPHTFRTAAPEAEVIFNWSGGLPLFRDVFLMCPKLRWVHSRSAGLERSLFPELLAKEIPLTNGSGVFSPSLGEFTLAAILYFAKDLRRMIRNQMAGAWSQFDVQMISGKTLGIVGYGDIGSAIATRCRAMGMKILALKRHLPANPKSDPLVDQYFGPKQLGEMLALCDYVAVAAPLTPETRGMVGAVEFAAMKKTAVVINVGRGPIIDEKAMIAALSEGRIRGAALDVFDEEPLPEGHPFYRMENVLLSPHCADHTAEWLDDAMRFFVAQFERYRLGMPLLNVVDKKLGY